MKTLINLSVLIASLTILLISACEPVAEPTGGDPRDAYVGEWNFNEQKSTAKLAYTVYISKDPYNSSQVLLENFGGSGIAGDVAKAIVTSSQMVIQKQTMSGSGWVTEGKGQMNNPAKTSLTLNYYFIIGADQETHITTATKQ